MRGYEPRGREFESLRARHNFNELRRPKKFHCPIFSALSNILETSKVVIGSRGTTVGSVVTQVGLLIGQRPWAIHRLQRVNAEEAWRTS